MIIKEAMRGFLRVVREARDFERGAEAVARVAAAGTQEAVTRFAELGRLYGRLLGEHRALSERCEGADRTHALEMSKLKERVSDAERQVVAYRDTIQGLHDRLGVEAIKPDVLEIPPGYAEAFPAGKVSE